jgi:hypothetical protein
VGIVARLALTSMLRGNGQTASDLVNSPKTDDARCIEPVRIERDMFERQWWGDG